MKKLIITLVLSIISLIGYSQDCDVKLKVDSFTQEKTLETDFIKFRQGLCKITTISDSTVCVWFSLNSRTYLIIEKDEILYLKLENGKIVKLYNHDTSIGKYSSSTGNYNTFLFLLEDEDLKELQESPITAMKIYINEYDISIGKRLQNNFKCILNFKL